MIIVIPMAGAGSRFVEAGYKVHKPAILTTDRRTGKKVPMVVAATMDLPGVGASDTRIIYVDRVFHKKDGVEDAIRNYYPVAQFITIDKLTEGQASTCLLAKEFIDSDEELLIAGCDNGMIIDRDRFIREKAFTDAIIFTYRHHDSVLAKPEAHGWVRVNATGRVTGMSVKKPVSNNPMDDHAVVATFWFRRGRDFVRAAEKMIDDNDRINGEFYVDQVMQHAVDLSIKVTVFEVERYLGWGTPKDYEAYESTIKYWRDFVSNEDWI